MLFRSFAHWLLVIFSLTVLATLAIVAGELGLLGETVRSFIDGAWLAFRQFYDPRSFIFDPAIKWIGFVGTALGAGWTVHKGWHYAEQNLPTRLNEYNARLQQLLEKQRPLDTLPLAHAISMTPDPPVGEGHFHRFLRRFYDPDEGAVVQAQGERDEFRNHYNVLTSTSLRCRTQLITAHLALGSQLKKARREADALNAFEDALRIDRNEKNALELAAKQAFALNRRAEAKRHLNALRTAAERGRDPVRRARAMRFLAELLKGGESDKQVEARNTLTTSIAALYETDIDADDLNRELALAYGHLADVQMVRNKLFAARTALNRSMPYAGRIPPPFGNEVSEWLATIENRLTQSENDRARDKEEGEDTDSDKLPSDPPEPANGAAEGKGDH